MKDYFISVYVWLFFLITLVFFFPLFFIYWLIIRYIDPEHSSLHYLTALWSKLYLCINPLWKYRIYNRKKLVKDRPLVVISNHQSLLDTLIIYQLNFRFKFVSKAELFRLPFLGWAMQMNNYIEIIRGNKQSTEKMMLRCSEELRKGCPIVMFPEGTRSTKGELQPFREGAFRMALENHKDLQILVLDGTSRALPKKGFVMHSNRSMKLNVMDFIPWESFKDKSPAELAAMAHEIMLKELTLMRTT